MGHSFFLTKNQKTTLHCGDFGERSKFGYGAKLPTSTRKFEMTTGASIMMPGLQRQGRADAERE
jgi:hypothetical protein